MTAYSQEDDIGPPPAYDDVTAPSAPPQELVEPKPIASLEASEEQSSETQVPEGKLLDLSDCNTTTEPAKKSPGKSNAAQNYFSLFDTVNMDFVNNKLKNALEDLDTQHDLEKELTKAPDHTPEIKNSTNAVTRTVLTG